MNIDEEKGYTKLVKKEYSPLTIRKYCYFGFPCFVALITDDNLEYLDRSVVEYFSNFKDESLNNIQLLRNLVGGLTERLREIYPKVEGIAVIIFPDKAAISSLWGDFMNHLHCRMELYMLINTMWNL